MSSFFGLNQLPLFQPGHSRTIDALNVTNHWVTFHSKVNKNCLFLSLVGGESVYWQHVMLFYPPKQTSTDAFTMRSPCFRQHNSLLVYHNNELFGFFPLSYLQTLVIDLDWTPSTGRCVQFRVSTLGTHTMFLTVFSLEPAPQRLASRCKVNRSKSPWYVVLFYLLPCSKNTLVLPANRPRRPRLGGTCLCTWQHKLKCPPPPGSLIPWQDAFFGLVNYPRNPLPLGNLRR